VLPAAKWIVMRLLLVVIYFKQEAIYASGNSMMRVFMMQNTAHSHVFACPGP